MARITTGVLGPFIGKVGPVVGSSWYGIPYMKAKYAKRTTKISDKEKQSRTRFAMAHRWLQPVKDVVREGFRNHSLKSRGFNAAKSYLIKNAFEGTDTDFFINPALVKVSSGDLPISTGITVEKSGPDEIKFTWDTEIPANADRADQAMLVAYDIKEKKAIFVIHGELRKSGSAIKSVKEGHSYHLYLAFIAHDRSRQSDSVYLGEISI